MIKCIKNYMDCDTSKNVFLKGNSYNVSNSDTFGIYVISESKSNI